MNGCIWLHGKSGVKIHSFLMESGRTVEQRSNVRCTTVTFRSGLTLYILETSDGTMVLSNGPELLLNADGSVSVGV